MKTTKKSRAVILTIIGIILAVYILFPFYLVVLNAFKKQTAIVANPVSLAGASFSQLITNLNAVINNSNFQFWYAFGTSAVVTIVSLILLALFGAMAAWVISRTNKKKWATAVFPHSAMSANSSVSRCCSRSRALCSRTAASAAP